MKKITLAGTAVLAVALGAVAVDRLTADTHAPDHSAAGSSAAPAEGAALVAVTLPEQLSEQAMIGKRAYDGVCAACHGQDAAGRMGLAPPLVHRIYEPSHHGDMAFQMAAANGVRSHHWPFGDMPPQPQVTPGDVKMIVAYVRELQRASGID